MATILTLEDIADAAEAKFGSTDIPIGGATVKLVSPVRLGKLKREELLSLAKGSDKTDEEDDADLEEVAAKYVRIIELAADTENHAELLLSKLRDEDGSYDLAKLISVVQAYMKAQQVGEA